jgi:large repetitive protein
MRPERRIRLLRAAAVGTAAVGLAAGAAGAALQSALADEVVNACRNRSTGALRVPANGVCSGNETPLQWNVRGPAGPRGPIGPGGPPGPASVDALRGSTCTTASGVLGTLAVHTAPSGAVTFSCRAQVDPHAPPQPILNELDYDQPGPDRGGFVELYNAGRGTADLGGLAIVLVDGGTASEYETIPLSGALLAGEFKVVPVDPDDGAPDGIALFDLAEGTLLDALSYEGAITSAAIGAGRFSLVEGTALPASVADSDAVAGSLARLPSGSDTDDAATDWAFTRRPTPGDVNLPSG